MKKLFSFFIILGIFFTLPLYTNAVSKDSYDVFYYTAPNGTINNASCEQTQNDVFYSFLVTSNKADIETERENVYNLVCAKYPSEDAFLSSEYAYFSYLTKDYIQISIDNEHWYTILSIDNDKIKLSLFNDILVCLRKNNIDISQLTQGFEFYLRLLTASENFLTENEKNVFAYSYSDAVSFFADKFGYIDYELPSKTIIPTKLPVFFSLPLKDDINLPSLEREGYIFDGWSFDNNKRVSIIPKNTTYTKLISHWIPLTYNINYFLTHNIDESIGKPNNSANPVKYTSGEGAVIYDINSPSPLYFFDGWYLNSDFSGEKVNSVLPDSTGDILLYAKWVSYESKRLDYIKQSKFGDVDDDGKVSSSDARKVLRAVVELENIPRDLLRRADYYGSGKIDSSCARITLRLAVGLDNIYDILYEKNAFPF